MNKTEIIPAILPKDFSEIVEKVSRVKGLAKSVQVDICDGRLTPSPSWPYENNMGEFERIIHEEEGMPLWQELDYEFDLMVNNPESVVENWILAGASRIVLHAEANGDLRKAIDILKGRVEIGLALNTETPIAAIGDSKLAIQKDDIQFIQLMGIDRVGFQGQQFDPRVIEKVREIKRMCPEYPVSIDGGVSLENARELIEAGADKLVVGSAIFGEVDAGEIIDRFETI